MFSSTYTIHVDIRPRLNVYQTLIRHLGSHINVFYAINLHSVSTDTRLINLAILARHKYKTRHVFGIKISGN